MYKFHHIPTDQFVPISHENSYLFNHYDKVANFLAFNLEKNYKNILAKPVQNGYNFDWFSEFENLVNCNEKSKEESYLELVKYWEFIDVINAKTSQLSASNDENNKNWANLLTKVFNHKDNFVYSNGKDICIVWGWQFDNTKNYKPNIISKPADPIIAPIIGANIPVEEVDSKPYNIQENPPVEENIEPEIGVFENEYIQDEIIEESSFKKFLKWFAAKFWWLLWLLTALIALVFLIKSFAFKIN